MLTISRRLLLSYFLVAVLPLAGLAAFYLVSIKGALTETVLANMANIADKKAEQVDTYMAERLADAQQLGQQANIRDGIRTIGWAFRKEGLGSNLYHSAASRLGQELSTAYGRDRFYDVLLIDATGNVVFSLARESDLGTNLKHGPYRDTELAQTFAMSMQTLQTHLSRFAPYAPSGNKSSAFLVAPVLSEGVAIGALAMQLDLNQLERVAADRTGLERTGETVLAQIDGRQVLYTSPLKHVSNAAYRHRVPLRDADLPMQRALAGGHGQGIILDYAGIEGVAAWRYLPALDWGMVVKIDTAEALAPIVELRRITYLSLVIFLLLSGAAAYFLGRGLSHPIRKLTEVADLIAAGDFSRRAPLGKIDELGRLAHAFNHMTEELADAQHNLEAKVEDRSRALRALSSLQDAILDQAGALVVVLDKEGCIRRFNRACEKLTHYSFAEVEGRFVWDFLLLPEERERVYQEAFAALARNPKNRRNAYINH